MTKKYRPNQQMAQAARQGLEIRKQMPNSQKGGTQIGLARARQFSTRSSVSLETVQRTYNFLSRARTYYKPGQKTPGTQAYLLWGGPAALAWSRNILAKNKKD